MIGKGRFALVLMVFAAIAIAAASTIWATHATQPSRTNRAPKKLASTESAYGFERIYRGFRADSAAGLLMPRCSKSPGMAARRLLSSSWQVEGQLADPGKVGGGEMRLLMLKSQFLLYEGEAEASYETLKTMRSRTQADEKYARNLLATVIFARESPRSEGAKTTTAFCAEARARAFFPFRPPPCTPIPPARGWRSGTSRNTSSCFPTISGCAGC